jgi:hypothetical protein
MSRHFIPFRATRQGAATVELRLDVLHPDLVGPISCAVRHIYLRIVRAILLKGATFSELALDAWALAGLMLVAMTIAVTRFRRTLD